MQLAHLQQTASTDQLEPRGFARPRRDVVTRSQTRASFEVGEIFHFPIRSTSKR